MALKRESKTSMFDVLKKEEPKVEKKPEVKIEPKVETAKEVKPEPIVETNKEVIKETITETKPEPVVETVIEPVKEVKPEPIIEPVKEVKPSVNAFDFGKSKRKENKSIRKQFVLTPTYAEWLRETAKLNNMSENAVIETLIEMAMNKEL